MLIFSKEDLALEKAKNKEWVLSNGIGGYTSSTILGLNTRKQHGLLVSSLVHFGRKLVVSKFEETLVIDNEKYFLSVNKFPARYSPQGHNHLEGFVFNFYPTFNYKIKNIDVIKSICMVQGKNAVVVSYKIISDQDFKFIIRPLINSRDINKNTHEPDWVFNQSSTNQVTVIKPSYLGASTVIIGSDKCSYKKKGFWIENMEYEMDLLEGNNFYDNHFCAGEFHLDVKKGITNVNFLIVGENVDEAYTVFDNLYSRDFKEYEKFFQYHTNRIRSLMKSCYDYNGIKENNLFPYLIQDLDSFVIKDQKFNEINVLSGYYSNEEIGREVMISFPGLFLVTGRIEDAKLILLKYAKHFDKGLIPNKIYSNGNDHYSVDTSLWFIYACYKFYKYTNNLHFIRLNLWNKIKQIIDTYKYRSIFGFGMDKDGLIRIQDDNGLTWMNDLKRDGKCVEVNVLWYNALKITELFAKRFNEDFEEYLVLGNLVKKSFNEQFWNHDGNYLFDRVDNDFKDSSLRPNQLFAVSLPFRLLNLKKEYLIVKKVTEELLISYGLRSLSNKDLNYVGIYSSKGKKFNGLVYGWLLGTYISSYLKIHNYSAKGKDEAYEKIVKNILHNLKDYGVGCVNDVYDGDFPFRSRGLISSCLSTSEIVRCYVEDLLKQNL